ncbi:AraC family transcriptional regulator [Vallitalea pronyensis]|uniref:AraC family transcriptional regulator n=1 Tax=Vallitalea pronyensis TaxID=1348613 RepID=A0A8J8MM37_9FIRM|nr:AraC family transcriptional regulator [Vallitalea pronyensis]QUI24039.1 AraC family transcriptional regulator [Vallitalea pronyensis]
MDWLTRMNHALEYIEENLTEEIDKQHIAKLACCSEFHFYRLFSFIAGISLGEYIRHRRLTKAAFEVQNSSIKILDLALKYGYESPEAFTRAFQKLHGVTPTLARNEGVALKAYPKITFHISIKGDEAMDYRIESKEGFTVYGIEEFFSTENGENLKEVPRFWEKVYDDGRYDSLIKSTNTASSKGLSLINSICDYRKTENNLFPYMLFAFMTDKSNTSGYKTVDVPASTWAIFKSKDHSSEETSIVIQDLIKRVYTEWLPTANYDKVDGYELEMYYEDLSTGKHHCETWIRVAQK